MGKVKVDRDREHLVAVVAPRNKTKDYSEYLKVLTGVIHVIDEIEYKHGREKNQFVFMHDGVTSGALSSVIEAINKIKDLLTGRDRIASLRKRPLDIEFYGKRSQHQWVDDLVEYKPDYYLILDDGTYQVAQYAVDVANENDIDYMVVRVKTKEQK